MHTQRLQVQILMPGSEVTNTAMIVIFLISGTADDVI
jgi:hypothetical protein